MEASPFTARQLRGPAIEQLGQSERVGDLVDRVAPSGSVQSRPAPRRTEGSDDRSAWGRRPSPAGRHRAAFGPRGDPRARRPHRRTPGRRRVGPGRQTIDSSVVLPAPFGPEQSDDLARRDLQIDAVEDASPAVALDQTRDLERRRRRHAPPPFVTSRSAVAVTLMNLRYAFVTRGQGRWRRMTGATDLDDDDQVTTDEPEQSATPVERWTPERRRARTRQALVGPAVTSSPARASRERRSTRSPTRPDTRAARSTSTSTASRTCSSRCTTEINEQALEPFRRVCSTRSGPGHRPSHHRRHVA